jgi:hypothetical protein
LSEIAVSAALIGSSGLSRKAENDPKQFFNGTELQQRQGANEGSILMQITSAASLISLN